MKGQRKMFEGNSNCRNTARVEVFWGQLGDNDVQAGTQGFKKVEFYLPFGTSRSQILLGLGKS